MHRFDEDDGEAALAQHPRTGGAGVEEPVGSLHPRPVVWLGTCRAMELLLEKGRRARGLRTGRVPTAW